MNAVDPTEIATPDVDDFDPDAEWAEVCACSTENGTCRACEAAADRDDEDPDVHVDSAGVTWRWVTGSVGGGENFQTFGYWQADTDPAEDRADGTLGSCGCIDYHYADCPTRG